MRTSRVAFASYTSNLRHVFPAVSGRDHNVQDRCRVICETSLKEQMPARDRAAAAAALEKGA